MKSALGLVLVVVAVLCGGQTIALAVEPTFKLLKAEGQLHDSVPAPLKVENKNPAVFADKLTPPPGKIVLTVTAYLLPEFTKPGDVLMIRGSKVQLLDGEAVIPPIGTWAEYAALYKADESGGDAVLYEPNDWKTKPHPLMCNWVYLAPAGKKTFTLRIADQTTTVAVAAQRKAVEMKDVIAFKIISAKLVNSVPVEQRDPLANPKGKLLLVKCEWEAKATNNVDGTKIDFQFPHAWMNVTYGKNQIAPTVADLGFDGKATGVSRRIQ